MTYHFVYNIRNLGDAAKAGYIGPTFDVEKLAE